MAGKSGGVVLDTVMIEIESNAGHATNNIDNLAKSLENLKGSIKGGFNNINKLAKGLEALKNASKGLGATVTNLTKLESVVAPLNRLGEIKTPTGLKNITNILNQLPDAMAKIDGEPMKNISKISQQLSEALSPLAAKLADISNGFDAVSKLANKYGKELRLANNESKDSVVKFGKMGKLISFIKSPFKQVTNASNDFTKTATRGFTNLYSKIKQVGLSLLGTRTLFTMVRKAVSEYMQMDQELTKATTNLWRALGAQLAPAIEYVIRLFTQFVRVIYSIVYALTGIDLIARANAKAMSSWGKSAKDTLGSLQKFDDLNVVEFKQDNGMDNLIELEKIDLTPIQKVIDWMKELKKAIETAWSTGQWNGVGKVLAEGINGAINWIDPKLIGSKVSDGIVTALSAIETFIDTIEWDKLGTKIRETIEEIEWKEIWDSIVEVAKTSFGGLKEFLSGLFDISDEEWAGLEGAIIGIGAAFGTYKVIESFNSLSNALDVIGINLPPIEMSFGTFAKTLGGVALIASGIYLVIDGIIKFLESPTWKAFAEILAGIALILGGIALILGSIPLIIAAIVIAVVALIVNCWDEISAFFVKVWDVLVNAWHDFEDWLGNLWGSVKAWFSNMKEKWNNFWSDLWGGVSDWFDSIKEKWNNFWGDLWDGCRNVINDVIGGFEGFVNGLIRGINWIKRQLNNISVDIPDWVPGIGGKTLGFNLAMSSEISLPRLETGTNEVPYDNMLAVLHKGEAVVPKKYNPALGGGNSQEMLERFDRLIFLMENQEQTTNVYVGNKKLYQEQKKYNNRQYNKYGTLEA